MNKVKLIIAREYLTRVKKLSFLVMTILGPILMAALIIVPVYINSKMQKTTKIVVVDDNDMLINAFENNSKATYSYRSGNIEEVKKEALSSGEFDAVLHILEVNYKFRGNLYYYEEPPINLKTTIESQIDKLLFDRVLMDSFNIEPSKFESIKNGTQSSITMIMTDEEGNLKQNFTGLNRLMGIVFGFAIYMFIFMFASQVLRGVLEEKTNRIVEVLLSSVKPIQLMLGKIVGVAMVGLTQFALWVVLTMAIVFGAKIVSPTLFGGENPMTEMTAQDPMSELGIMSAMQGSDGMGAVLNDFYSISFTQIILSFLFYFLFGYLLYAALFAGVGSAADNETDSGQFTMPVTIPLLLTLVLIMPIADDPNSAVAWWFSMIPLTSPVAMLVRLPSGVPLWELLTSMGLLVLFFFFCVWFAAKIYRTGILMYGKKITFKELFKWLKY